MTDKKDKMTLLDVSIMTSNFNQIELIVNHPHNDFEYCYAIADMVRAVGWHWLDHIESYDHSFLIFIR